MKPAEPTDPSEVTLWLRQLGAASPQASSRLFELLYDELRRMARAHLRRENPAHTLSATGLAHEAWFRMAGQTRTQWQNRNHFLAVASTMMRRILVNHELARRADKRDVELVPVTLSGLEQIGAAPDRDVVAVHEALLAFEAVDARWASAWPPSSATGRWRARGCTANWLPAERAAVQNRPSPSSTLPLMRPSPHGRSPHPGSATGVEDPPDRW